MDEDGRARCLLRIGAWKHMKQPALEHQTTEHLDNESIIPVYVFFKTLLQDRKAPETGVKLYTIGEDRWTKDTAWPDPTGEKLLWLDAGAKGKRLLDASPELESQAGYVYDPADPLPCWGTESCLKSMFAVGSLLQPEPDYRPDVLSFVSAPMEEDLRILGALRAELYVCSDAEDTAFVMKVSEVFPDGSAYNIRTAATTLAYRGHSSSRQSYTPGETVPVRLDAWDIAWTVKAGSRIRVYISSADFPEYSVHSNFAGTWSEQEQQRTAHQTVFCGGEHASVLRIPFVTETPREDEIRS